MAPSLREEALPVFEGARTLLSDPKRWTKGSAARKADFVACSPTHPEATCFCLIGAMLRSLGYRLHDTQSDDSYEEAYTTLTRLANGEAVVDWNDKPGRTRGEVLAFLRKGIKKLRESSL